MDWLGRELRVALRRLARDRAFSVTVAVTLAACLGANVALFSVVRQVLLRPLPVPAPERLLHMGNDYPKAGAGGGENSAVPDYYDRLRETSVFEEQALFNQGGVGLEQDGLPTRVQVMNVTPSYFRVMRVAPALGRTFLEPEGEPGNEHEVVLSAALWRSLFGADPGALGRDLRLDGQPYRVVGVMPGSFQALAPRVALWRPLAFSAEQKADSERHSNNYTNLGRLKPGASLEQAKAQIDALNAANLERFPEYRELLINAGFHTVVERYQDHLVRQVRPTLRLLWGGALFVLLIGCVNIANLVLGRARTRLKELATRQALGASPGQLARALVVENLALALAAAALGLLLGAVALRGLGGFDLQDLPYGTEIRLDLPAALYGLLLSLAVGVAMGLIPLASAAPSRALAALREEGRSASLGRGAGALRRGLIVAQVAFTFVLLLGAGLLLASFRRVLDVDPGFVAEGVTTASVLLPKSRYPDDDRLRSFTEEALRRLRSLPGVLGAGATDSIPFGGHSSDSVILAEGHVMRPGESVVSPNAVDVTPGCFEAMGVRLLRGRFFQDGDGAKGAPVVIVDRKLAERFWPGQDAVGRRMFRPTDINDLLAVDEKTVFLTVVGVVRDVKLKDLTDGASSVGVYYFPMAQDPSRLVSFAVKTAGNGAALPAALRASLAGIDPELPLFDVQTMEQRTQGALRNRRAPALLSLGYGLLALLLSGVGIYGVLAYLVTQRRKEIGIRVALGSTARGIFELVVREGLLLLGSGFLLGGLGAFGLGRLLEGQLFGVRPADPGVLAGASLLLALVALVACVVPARRATRIDPRLALSE